MRILILRSNPVAPDPRVEKIARALAGGGYDVQIVGWDRTAGLKTTDALGGIPICRLPIAAQYGNGIGNLPALLRWQVGLLRWLIQNRVHYDIIHACDFDTVLPALLCKAWWGKRVIYDIFDFYADHLRRTPDWMKRWIRLMDFRAINRADGVILVDDARSAQIAGAQPKRCTTVYNTPEDAWYPAHDGIKPSSKGLQITYVGLLQVERGIFEMMNVVQSHPEWALHMAGFGGDEQKIAGQAENLTNVHWYGRVPYEKAIQLSAQADVLFATYDPAIPNHRFSSANKVFEGMMLGKPVIVARGTNMDRMIEQYNCGIVVEYGNIKALEEALLRLDGDPDLRERLGRNGRRAYEEVYSWGKMEERLLRFYEEITGNRTVTDAPG